MTVHRRRGDHDSQYYVEDDGSHHSDDESSCDSFSSCSSLDSMLQYFDDGDNNMVEGRNTQQTDLKANRQANRTAVMTNVPPFQVPDGTVFFYACYILHVDATLLLLTVQQSVQEYSTWCDPIVLSLNTFVLLLDLLKVRSVSVDELKDGRKGSRSKERIKISRANNRLEEDHKLGLVRMKILIKQTMKV